MTSLFSFAAASVLPHWPQPTLKLGPLSLHLFGALVACAVLFGSWVIRKRAERERLDVDLIGRMVFWILIFGFIGAHLVDRFVYFPKETLADPITILKFWSGISSFGGFIGALIGALVFIRREKLGVEKWRYCDVIVFGFVFGWIFGRAGCFVAFDHPGSPSDFFLAQLHREPDGSLLARHNLGLYEAIYFLVILAPLFAFLGRVRRAPGFYAGVLCLMYGPIRFVLDFARIVDVRYAGLTPGQWGSIALSLFGVYLLVKSRSLAAAEAAQAAPGAGGKGGKAR